MSKRDLTQRIVALEAENQELRARVGELPTMPCNSEGLPFSAPRLIIVRMVRGRPVSEMADMLKITKRDYIGIESETVAPTMEQIGNLSMLLHWPIKFFFAKDSWLIDMDSSSLGPYEYDADSLHIRRWIR